MMILSGCDECPTCHSGPVLITDGEAWTLVCEHGYMAVGNTLDLVKANWNHFIQGIQKVA